MKTVVDLGILGGMGPRATHYFTEELFVAVESRCHPSKDQDYPSIFVRYACYIPDRTSALMGDRYRLRDAISREAEILVRLGCLSIVMPCITAHAILDSDLSGFPFLDIRKVVAEEIGTQFPKATIGILATRGARHAGATDKFLSKDQKAVFLRNHDEDRLMTFVYEDAKTWNLGRDGSTLRALLNNLRERGCNLIIAGCTEVEMCFAKYFPTETDIVLPLRMTARSYAQKWSEQEA